MQVMKLVVDMFLQVQGISKSVDSLAPRGFARHLAKENIFHIVLQLQIIDSGAPHHILFYFA